MDENFLTLSCRLLDAAPDGVRAAFATHDERLVKRIKDEGSERGMSRGDLEFQMLYGINTALQRSLAAQGHTVRTLISYGSGWFPWYMRRLAERPANLWFVVKNMVST